MRISNDARAYERAADPNASPAQHFQAGLNFAKGRERQLARLATNGRVQVESVTAEGTAPALQPRTEGAE